MSNKMPREVTFLSHFWCYVRSHLSAEKESFHQYLKPIFNNSGFKDHLLPVSVSKCKRQSLRLVTALQKNSASYFVLRYAYVYPTQRTMHN